MRIYLASPFFNDEARKVCVGLLESMERNGHSVFAPMRDGIMCPKDAPWKKRKEVFELDCRAIIEANLIVAVLDYPLPITEQIYLHQKTPDGPDKLIPISLPDSGTVFEMGIMHAMATQAGDKWKGIVGYSGNPKLGLNLMLEQACQAIVNNFKDLLIVLNFLEIEDWAGLNQWRFEVQKKQARNLQEF
jgi:nucleoside 2-deoxyribosyltransferase